MSQRLYRASWLALGIVLAARVWLVMTNLRYTYGEWWPSNPEPFTFGLFLYGNVAAFALVCLGVWLLSSAWNHGGGRLWWRWWLGGLLTISWVGDVADDVVQALGPEKILYIDTAHPWLSDILLLLAIPPIWVLGGRR